MNVTAGCYGQYIPQTEHTHTGTHLQIDVRVAILYLYAVLHVCNQLYNYIIVTWSCMSPKGKCSVCDM